MDKKILISGVVVLVVLLGLLGLKLGKQGAELNPSVSSSERFPLQSLSLSEIGSFSIQQSSLSLNFKKIKIENTAYYGIVEKKNYPADGILVSRFLDSLKEMLLIRKLKSSEKLLKECGLDEQHATQISLYKEDGALLHKLFLGKESSTGGHFIRRENDAEQIFLTEEKIAFPENAQVWEDLRLPRLVQKHIRSIRFSFPREGLAQTYTIRREQEEAPLKPQESEFSSEHLNTIINFLGQLQVQRLIPMTLADAGLEKPVQIVEYHLTGDAQIFISIGNLLPWKKEDKQRQRYVALDFKISQASPEELKSYYLDWKKRSGNHLFLLSDSQEFALLNFQTPMLGKLDTLQEILMQQKEKMVQIKREGEAWTILNGYDFPADSEKIKNFIGELEEIKSRPGDIANTGISADLYQDKEESVHYTLTLGGNVQKKFTQGKARKGEEDKTSEDQYKRVYFIDDLCEVSDEWGNYYVKPSGAITLGSRAPSVDLNPSYWLQKEIGHFSKETLDSLQLQIKEKQISWSLDEKGTWVPSLAEVKSEDFLNALKEFTISDVVKLEEKDLLQQFEQQQEMLRLSAKKKNGLKIQVQIRGQDAQGFSLGKVFASYEEPSLPPDLLEIARQEKEKSMVDFQQAELHMKETIATYDLALQRAEKVRADLVLETQQCEELKQQTQHAKGELASAYKKNEEINQLVVELKTQHIQKAQQLEESQKRSAELAQAVANLTQENPELQAQAKLAQEEVAKLQEELEKLRQNCSMKELHAEESKKLLAGLEQSANRLQQDLEEKTQQLQKKQENATDLSNATQSLKEKVLSVEQALIQAKKLADESTKKYEQLEKEMLAQKEANDAEQKARETKANEARQEVEKINKAFGSRLVKWDRETSLKLFALPITPPVYSVDFLNTLNIKAGDTHFQFQKDSTGEWKQGEQYIKRDQIESLFKQLASLDLRYGFEDSLVTDPQITLILSGAETSNTYKIGASFEVKVGDETKQYKRFQWNDRAYLIADSDFNVVLDPKHWNDLRLIRSSVKEFQSLEIESSTKGIKHLLVMKNGRFEFPDLASDHAMFDSGLEENLDHLFETLALNSFEERKDENVALSNTLTFRRLGSELLIRFSEPQEDSIYLTLVIHGTSDALTLQKALEKKWAKVPSHLLEGLFLKREEMEGLSVYVSHILVSWKGAERSRSNKTKEQARQLIEEVQQKLKDPNADFSALAKEYSDEPAAKQSGGVIPVPLQKDTQGYDETFKATALTLEKPGSLSAIIETKFGFHILKRDQ